MTKTPRVEENKERKERYNTDTVTEEDEEELYGESGSRVAGLEIRMNIDVD